MKELIDKYLNDSINGLEMERLKVWLEKEKNQKKFKTILESHYLINLGIQEVDLDREYSLLMDKLEGKSTSRSRSGFVWFKRASIFLGLLGLAYMIQRTTAGSDKMEVNGNAIMIKQENGNAQIIKEDGSVEIVDNKGRIIGKQNGTQLDYRNSVAAEADNLSNDILTYNELVVPYGKKMKLILSDSTVVHINSGTSLKYPVKFLENKDRKVFLEGEAFFEVTKSNTAPFIVNTDKIDIRVLGTKFDVSAYRDDEHVSTVLVEGSVEISTSGRSTIGEEKYLLEPGQIGSWNKSMDNINIAETDVNEYTSWINGEIIFRIRPFPEILKVLERHYNVSITNNYRLLDRQQFFAKFDTESIEQVLTYFQNSTPFQYTRNGDRIEIDQPQ
ncbi:FecR family protein [Arenibacter sp. S6351L]|uniref:FecR family protein n=1 Tax=Arenibacter sp. S6351L TaxID=2926407 RepID=UPI001FF6DFAA|nr:FecR family protein [Arenibacter sp. S6351L]MCK0137017.1 FecR family protein [Arenibacter sp. S6351L]